MSFANSANNWFQEVDCRLQAWPEGNAGAVMVCNDGKQRTMQVPGDGIVMVDDVQYVRVFDSEETKLPPPEVMPDETLTAAERAALGRPRCRSCSPKERARRQRDRTCPTEAPIPLAH